MMIEDFLSNDAFVMTNKRLIKLLWLGEAVFLQELISQRKRFKQDEFYFTQNDMENELWISASTQLRYAKKIRDMWLISFEKKWIPARNYYTINDDAIINLLSKWQTSSVKMTALDTSDWRDYSYINNTDNKNSLSWDWKPIKQWKEKIGENWSGELTLSENVIEWLKEYDKSKKNKFKNFTKKWFWLAIEELKELWHWTDEWMIAVLQQSIRKWWEWLFEVKWFKPKVDYENNLDLFLKRMRTDYEWLKNELGKDKFFELKTKALAYWAVNKLL